MTMKTPTGHISNTMPSANSAHSLRRMGVEMARIHPMLLAGALAASIQKLPPEPKPLSLHKTELTKNQQKAKRRKERK